MSDHLEDLYLKGFMAFSAKNFSSAKAYWQKVLAEDPNHPKALKGMADLKGLTTRKRSSREVFQEIKTLYADKNYAEALKLCNLLLKKYPDNQDLQGLQKKLINRSKNQTSDPGQPAVQVDPRKSTIYMADMAAASIGAEDTQHDGGTGSKQVEKLIQDGVSLYEVQDYKQAIACWEKALALDPENRIARDYIENVRTLAAEEAGSTPPPEAAPAPASAPPLAGQKPGKDALIQIYNAGMNLFKEREYRAALEKWEYIIGYYPNHAETLQCIEKTKGILAKEQEHLSKFAQAQADFEAGNTAAAERAVTQLSIEAPHLAGVDQLREAIETKQEEVSQISSLELEDDGVKTSDFSATDDQITQFFGAEGDGAPAARQVSKMVSPKKKKQPASKFLLVGLPLILIVLGVGGYFGFNYYQNVTREQQLRQQETVLPFTRAVDWDSHQQKARDFLNLGDLYMGKDNYLLASLAFQRVEDISEPRLVELDNAPNLNSIEVQSEIRALNECLTLARAKNSEAKAQIKTLEVGPRDAELATSEMRRGRLEDASVRLFALLSNDPEHTEYREMLGRAQQQLALKRLAEKSNDYEALELFQSAAVLLPGYEMARRHMEVTQRYFDGKISEDEKNQWFFFFRE